MMWCACGVLAMGLGLTQLPGCSSNRDPRSNEARLGTLGLSLEATALSGNVYRLRNARFRVADASSGKLVKKLSSEDAPESAPELDTELPSGNYTITLLDGWYLEPLGTG